MITGLSPSTEKFLNQLSRAQARAQDAQEEITSGRRVNSASDAPYDVSDILQLQTEIGRNATIQTNLTRVQTEATAADGALNAAIDLVQRATVLATQASSPAQTAGSMPALAQEVQSILDQLVSVSNTTVEGRYIFGGDLDTGPAYQRDATQPDGVLQLSNAAVTRQIEDSTGSRYTVAKPASEIFDPRLPDGTPATGNAFAAVNRLLGALQAGDSSALPAIISDLEAANGHLNEKLTYYGATEDRLAASVNSANSADLQLKSELSRKQDADLSQAIMELTQVQTQQQAAMMAQMQMPRKSLFDYLG